MKPRMRLKSVPADITDVERRIPRSGGWALLSVDISKVDCYINPDFSKPAGTRAKIK
jgi:hypothetical protein